VTEPCAHCKRLGHVGRDVFPYSMAKGVTAMLHSACERAYYAAWRAQYKPESLL
jgi:hypothetical protein